VKPQYKLLMQPLLKQQVLKHHKLPINKRLNKKGDADASPFFTAN
jgi:hypothetical protein